MVLLRERGQDTGRPTAMMLGEPGQTGQQMEGNPIVLSLSPLIELPP